MSSFASPNGTIRPLRGFGAPVPPQLAAAPLVSPQPPSAPPTSGAPQTPGPMNQPAAMAARAPVAPRIGPRFRGDGGGVFGPASGGWGFQGNGRVSALPMGPVSNNPWAGLNFFTGLGLDEAGQAQQYADDQWQRLNQLISQLSGGLDQFIPQMVETGEEEATRITTDTNRDVEAIRERVERTELGLRNDAAQLVQAQTLGSQRRIQTERQRLEAMRSDGTVGNPQEIDAQIERLRSQEGELLTSAVSQLGSDFNRTLAQVRTMGTEIMSQAYAGRLEANKIAADVRMGALNLASQLHLNGRSLVGQMIAANPQSLVSRLAVYAQMFAMASTPGAAGAARVASGLPWGTPGGVTFNFHPSASRAVRRSVNAGSGATPDRWGPF